MFPWETYPPLDAPGLRHAFSLRAAIPFEALAGSLRPAIAALGWGERAIVEAEQPHGNGVSVVDSGDDEKVMPGVDALVTFAPKVILAIRAADCGPVFFHDPVRKAVAIAHSGRKGTEQNIVGETMKTLVASGCRAGDIRVFLGPCIRPPHYEVDFAAAIGRQAWAAGVVSYADSGIDTAADLSRYYSYRAEKGKTGRMWAVAMLEE
jgi:polyphenol oxidase